MNGRLAPVVAVMLSVAACGGQSTPTPPTTPPSAITPAGTWSGSIRDPISGDGTARLSLDAQAPNGFTGTWSVTFSNGDRFSGPAVATLAATGYGIILYVDPQPSCGTGSVALMGFTLINVTVTSSQLTAVTGRMSCSGPSFSFGSVNLSRQ